MPKYRDNLQPLNQKIMKSIIVKTVLLSLGLVLCVQALAQPKSTKFGKADEKRVTATEVKEFPEASAAFLYKHMEVAFDNLGEGYRIVYKIHNRIKIVKESATDWADIGILYNNQSPPERVTEIKGIVYNTDENGEVIKTKFDKKNLFEEDIDGNNYYKRFSLPNVKEGSIIEYQYKIVSSDFYYPRTFYCQNSIPIVYGKLVLKIPQYFVYILMPQGDYVSELEYKNENWSDGWTGSKTTYIIKNMPPVPLEPFLPSYDEYATRIRLQLQGINIPGVVTEQPIQSWNQFAQFFSGGEYKGIFADNKTITKVTQEVIAGKTTDQEKYQAITAYLKENTTWNKKYSKYLYQTVNQLTEAEELYSSEINLLLIGMLKAAGMEANPILISTRTNGKPQTAHPSFKDFNHTIASVVIDGKETYVDRCKSYIPIYELPLQSLNYFGFKITSKDSKWIEINTPSVHTTNVSTNFTLNPESASLNGSCTWKGSVGYSAGVRKQCEDQNPDEQEKFILDDLLKDYYTDFTLNSKEIQNLTDWDKPLVLKTKFESSDYCNKAGDFLYIKPMIHEGYTQNMFPDEERKYPIDFGVLQKHSYSFVLTVPEGYEIESVPEAATLTTSDQNVSFVYQIMTMGSFIQLSSILQFRQPAYTAESYQDLRSFFEQIVSKHAEQIVLKKK